MMNYRNIQLPSSRILEWSKQGENKATRLNIDVSEFIKRSEGTIAVSCCRPDGKKYPHDCTINDTTVEIELSSYDTQVCGILTIVVSWMCGERIVKSEIYCGEISRSISTSGEKPTPPFDGLIEQVCNAAIKTKESADRAEAAAERAENAGGIAEDAAQRAEAAAERAENAGGITEETDPTVPAWAKQPTKPSYTADEVNARPADWKPTPQEIGAASAGDVVKLSGEITQLKDDLAAITPDDSAVDGKPWTSRKIVDTLCPPFEVSGSAVTCHPVEHYPLGAVSRIEPIQSGSGDPSPDNIRPIVGWDIVSVTRCGKNLIDYSKMVDTTSNGVKYLKQPDGGISVTGTAIKESWCQPLYNTSTAIPAGVYTTSLIGKKNTSLQVVIKRASGNNQWVSGTFVIADGDILLYTYIRVEGGNTCNETVYPMLVEGNIAPTAYEPYTGDTYTAELPETIYGGELDWITGVLTVTHGQIASYAGETLPGEWISDRDVYAPDATPTTGAQVAYKLAEPYTIQLTRAVRREHALHRRGHADRDRPRRPEAHDHGTEKRHHQSWREHLRR